ncbi:hypothetical protein [Burkholderia cenocepacia]|uniref:hypothetical protein n=1 Tax=Burkholderia cenocepacia TaxID=95486 RepID=UPI003D72D8FD
MRCYIQSIGINEPLKHLAGYNKPVSTGGLHRKQATQMTGFCPDVTTTAGSPGCRQVDDHEAPLDRDLVRLSGKPCLICHGARSTRRQKMAGGRGATQPGTIAIGSRANAAAEYALAIGRYATAGAERSMALG